MIYFHHYGITLCLDLDAEERWVESGLWVLKRKLVRRDTFGA